MNLWVDADACPKAIKEVVCRAAQRTQILTTFVANQFVNLPKSPYLARIQVEQGFDKADAKIVELVAANDLVITADIPLAAEVVEKKANALNPRGRLYTPENIAAHLARRNFMEELRSTGTLTGGPQALGKVEVAQFANALDSYLTKHS